jgi:hypothetical protein
MEGFPEGSSVPGPGESSAEASRRHQVLDMLINQQRDKERKRAEDLKLAQAER